MYKTMLDQEITGDVLLDLTADALKELNIATYGKRYKIMQAIHELKDRRATAEVNQIILFIHSS